MLFLVGFSVLIVIVSRYFLLPALDAYQSGDEAGRKLLSAHSALLLSLLLLVLISGLLLTFRIGRFFFPRAAARRTQTKYVDIWAESGKRTPPE